MHFDGQNSVEHVPNGKTNLVLNGGNFAIGAVPTICPPIVKVVKSALENEYEN